MLYTLYVNYISIKLGRKEITLGPPILHILFPIAASLKKNKELEDSVLNHALIYRFNESNENPYRVVGFFFDRT